MESGHEANIAEVKRLDPERLLRAGPEKRDVRRNCAERPALVGIDNDIVLKFNLKRRFNPAQANSGFHQNGRMPC